MKVKKRQYLLIKMLCLTDTYKPTSYYSNKLNVSTRTISNDLDNLNEFFQKYHIILDKRPNRGIILKGTASNLKRFTIDFQKNINEDSIYEWYINKADILKILVLEEQVVTYENLAFVLCTSTSIVSKNMKELRKFENEDCKIVSNVSGTRIKGTEYGMQRLLKDFFNEYINKCFPNISNEQLVKELSNYYPERALIAVKETLASFQGIFKKTLEDYYINSLFIFLATIITRKLDGKDLIADYKFPGRESIEFLSNYYLAVEINERFEKKLEIKFTKNETVYTSYQLFMHKIELNINNKYLENMFSKHTTDFINKIGASVDLDLSHDQYLYDTLICHIIPMIYRIKSNIIIANPILNEIKRSYPVLFNLTWFYLNDFAKTFDIKFSEDEVSFITIYLQVAIESLSPKGYVVIVCESGLLTSELLVSRISKNLPASVELKVVSAKNIKQEEIDSADFIISTISLNNLVKPYIKVSPFVTDEELKEVYYHYLKYSDNEIIRFNHNRSNNMRFIDELITPNQIHYEIKLKTKEECIEYLVNSLYVANCVHKDFKKDIINREKLGSTYLASGVSFPHAMSKNVKENGLSILLLPEGVFWDGNKVCLVMMLAIKEENIKKIVEELPILYKKVLNDEFISQMINITDVQDIYEMLHN